MGSGRARVVLAALGANLAITAFKFVVALVTQSSAMLAEATHSVADTANQGFLLLGVRLARRAPDERHPFGYATETYFWAFIVALCLFSVGATFSIYEGVRKLTGPPHELRHPGWALAVLGVSLVLECYSLRVAMREFRALRQGRSVRQTLEDARDPVVVTVLFEDSTAILGLLFAGLGVGLSLATGDSKWDGIASICIGTILGGVAFVLGRESKDLLLGESVPPSVRRRIVELAGGTPGVERVVHVKTMHLGPEEALAALKVKFADHLTTSDIERVTDEMEARLRAELPFLRRIYIEAGSAPPPASEATA